MTIGNYNTLSRDTGLSVDELMDGDTKVSRKAIELHVVAMIQEKHTQQQVAQIVKKELKPLVSDEKWEDMLKIVKIKNEPVNV